MRSFCLKISHFLYTQILKRILFLFDSERTHRWATGAGSFIGGLGPVRDGLFYFWRVKNRALSQEIAGVKFENPAGLSAGFDYEGKLTKILPALGFGFGTVGTITNGAYDGNPPPRMGRLVKSRSILVNKGFKNEGIKAIAKKFANKDFKIPMGLSIGKTNGKEMAREEAIGDIVSAFLVAEGAGLSFSYYELNISCPNLSGTVEFYEPEHLRELLSAVCGLEISKPLFIKMPTGRSNEETLKMLDAISEFPIAGVIFGNLQRDRNNPVLDRGEVEKFKDCLGSFSGKPAEARSNELIELAYCSYGRRLVIVGCGGIFSAEDAYKKIKLGASLIQLITGLVFEGPQLAGEINLGLLRLMEKDGYKNIGEAVGADAGA